MKHSFKAALALAAAACCGLAQAADLNVMTSGGFTAAYQRLAPQYAASSGDTLHTALGPSMGKAAQAIPNRLARGEPADAVIMVGYALDELIRQGKVDPASRVELADSRIGMVVREGQAKPAIATPEQLKQTLLAASSVAYSDSASGVYVEKELYRKLGIQSQLAAKSTMVERKPVAGEVANGTYQIGLQQVAELLPVPGVTFVGKLPEALQSVTRFAAGIPVGAQHPAEARKLLQYLASPAVQETVRATGLDSVAH